MGVPTSKIGYTPAMPRREDHEVHKDMWGIGGKKVFPHVEVISSPSSKWRLFKVFEFT